MEIKIPKEVREYHETIFFGLNTRQFVCSLLAVGVAVAVYFLLQPMLDTEEIGWVCILAAAPFAVCGFFTYHGMTPEQLLWAWCKSELLCPKRLVFRSDSYYYAAMQPAIQAGLHQKRKRGKRMRIKTRLDQMRAEGLYTGGPVRFGYQAIEKGRLNKKNKPVKDLVINPEEAAVIKEVFERTVYEGAGSFVLAKELNERGVRTHSGAKLTALSINRMLKERQYTGYLITKDVTSPYMPELQIIDQELFDQAQEIVTQRKTKNAEWRNIPRQNGNGALLGGNLYCATCGRRMTSSNPGKGAKRDKAEYICYMGANHRNNCTGQRSYVAKRVEDIVLQATRLLLDTIKDTPRDESVEARVQAEIKELKYDLRKTQQQIEEAAKEQEGLEMEVSRCLLGKSNFTTAMLSRLIDNKARERRELENKALDLERRLKNEKEMSEKVAEYYNRFLGWSMEFGLATIERKRIIISQLYKRIELGRGYVVNFEVDWNYEQFIDALQMEKHKGMTEVGIPMPPKVKKRVTKNINRKSDGAA